MEDAAPVRFGAFYKKEGLIVSQIDRRPIYDSKTRKNVHMIV